MKTIKDTIKNPKTVAQLKEAIMQDEYDVIIDADWTVSHSFEAQIYLSFDEKQKRVYALSQAKEFSEKMLNLSEPDFLNATGDRYHDVYAS